MDYDFYLANGNNTITTTNWMSAAFNSLKTLYINDGISISFKSLFIWTTQDPYQGIGPTSLEYYYKFVAVRPNFDADMGMQVGLNDGDLGGATNGLGNCNGHSYCNLYINYNAIPVYSYTIGLMAHEFGHTIGSPHTHSCVWNGNNTAIDNCPALATWFNSTSDGYSCYVPPGIMPFAAKGTIMSYCELVSVGINLGNGFGPQPKQRIINFIEIRSCLGTVCGSLLSNQEVSLQNFEMFPNPNTGSFKISFIPENKETIDIEIIDVGGRKVFTKSFQNTGFFKQDIKLGKVQSGVYLITIINGENKIVK